MPDKPRHPHRFYSLSESAISIEFGGNIDEQVLNLITNANRALLNNPFPGLITTTPAYTTLTVFYDPIVVITSALSGVDCFEKVCGYLSQLVANIKPNQLNTTDIITIPVCYGGEYGPDIEELAKHHNLSTHEVTHLHSSATYTVYMIGFLPGFAYMGGMTAQLATPRKGTPRKHVPAGSVGIAGMQTGIYPMQSPGGWQLIGQTPVKIFDIENTPPALLKAGDRVKFQPISVNEFKDLNH